MMGLASRRVRCHLCQYKQLSINCPKLHVFSR